MTDAIGSTPRVDAATAGALKRAAEATGVGFDYLYKVALRESALNPRARAATSSAAGLFQFIEETWLAAVKKYGAAHGLAAEAAAIARTPGGRHVVADPGQRRRILDLRFDAGAAAALAGELARENKTALEAALGRAIDAAELYAAHFLGAAGARKLLSAGAGESAAALLPAAARANAPVFYDGTRARTVGEVIDGFRRSIGGARDSLAGLGARLEKSLAPLLRETAATMRAPSAAAFRPPLLEFKSLPPLALALLQALAPRRDGE
jgi:hypothetical protein